MFFLEQLHLGDNVSFLQRLLAFMKQTQDAQEPPLEEVCSSLPLFLELT